MAKNEAHDPAGELTQLERTIRENMPPPLRGAQMPFLADRQNRLLGALGTMQTWITEIDQRGTLTYVSPQVEQITGFSPEESLATDCMQFHTDDLPKIIQAGKTVRRTGRPQQNQTRIRHKRGHWVWIESTVTGSTDAAGNFFTLIISRDISDIKRAEALQRESEARYQVVSQMSCDLITEMDREGRYTYVGPGSEEILGYSSSELLAIEPWTLVHPEDRERVESGFLHRFVAPSQTAFESSRQRLLEARIRHKDGSWLFIESHGVTYAAAGGETRYLAVSRDVTERVRAEEQRRALEEKMQRSQKLESLGVLAGGIAHDFNNLLTPIMGAAGLGLIELPNDSAVRTRLQTIHRAAKRAAALTNQMLAYAGQKPLRVEKLDLSALVEDMRELATSSVAGKTTLDLHLEDDLPFVEGEAAQLSQVIMNLISNAAEALAEGAGKLSIRTGVVFLEDRPADVLFAETMPLGEHVYFEVSDTGCGMDRETLDRIFDPFFTTKFTGRGLGLAAVAGIVRGHRGGISVDSAPGRGTRFRVMFPAVQRPSARLQHEAHPAHDFPSSGLALIIDDDEGVRELAEEILRRAGMTVLTAADGHEGVKLFDRHADEIGVVLLDRTMPSLSGSDTLEAIRAIRQNARVVLVSGYSEERVTAELAGKQLAGFLKKPFTPEALLSKVQEALEPD